MKIQIEFDVDIFGSITEEQAADIFFKELALKNNVITGENFNEDDEKYFALMVNGWSLIPRESAIR